MSQFKVGLIGFGKLGRFYGDLLAKEIKNVELIAVSSLNSKELEDASKDFGVTQLYSNYKELIQLRELDAVFILSPTYLHPKFIVESLEEGLHVFCEKPISLNNEEADLVEKHYQRYPNQVLWISQQRRFLTALSRIFPEGIKEHVGSIQHIISSCSVPDDTEKRHLLDGYPRANLVLQHMIDDIDMVQWICQSNIYSVRAQAHKKESSDELSTIVCNGRLDDNTFYTLSCHRTVSNDYKWKTQVYGDRGNLTLHSDSENSISFNGVPLQNVERPYTTLYKEAFSNQVRHFINLVTNQKRTNNLNSALVNNRVGIDIIKSYILNKEIEVGTK